MRHAHEEERLWQRQSRERHLELSTKRGQLEWQRHKPALTCKDNYFVLETKKEKRLDFKEGHVSNG